MYLIFAVIAMLAGLAAATIVPITFALVDLDQITLKSDILLVRIMLCAVLGYMVAQVVSAIVGRIVDRVGQGLYLVDLLPSVIALVSFIGTALAVGWFAFAAGKFYNLLDVAAFAVGLLAFLIVFAFIDVRFFQSHNVERAQADSERQRADQRYAAEEAATAAAEARRVAAEARAANPNPAPLPARRGDGGNRIAVAVFLGLIALAAILGVVLLLRGEGGTKAKAAAGVTPPTLSVVTSKVFNGKVIVQRVEHPFADVPKERQYRCAANAAGVMVAATPGTGWCYND